MTRPLSFLFRMLVFLAAVATVAIILSPVLITFFVNNPLLNGLILVVLGLGIVWNLRQVVRLTPEVGWLEGFQQGRQRAASMPTPRLLAPMASMLAARTSRTRDGREHFTLSSTATRSLLDSIASRLDESRELSRYMTGLLIFLGLLGTFWGLLLTVSAISDVIGGMSVGSGDISAMFEQLKGGLVRPLRGMGTAFSSSMFGLSGALVLGFLDLTAGQAQNRFFNELEEWLAGITRLSSGALGNEGEGSVPAYVQALLEQTAENMEGLQNIMARGEDSRGQANHAVLALTERLSVLSEAMRANHQLMLHIGETQAQLGPALHQLATQHRPDNEDAGRAHLRNIEALLARMLTDQEQGRLHSTAELRNEIRVLTRTIAALSEAQPQ